MILHNSRQAFYREPFGAVPSGTNLTIRLGSDEAIDSVALRLWWDNAEQKISMTKQGQGVFEARFLAPDHPGLLWYFFVLEMADGQTRYYGNAHDRLGGEGAVYECEPPSYQLTVYDAQYDPPHWLRDGVLYHIMVDRFRASRQALGRPAPAHGHWHQDWFEPPELNVDTASSDNMADDFFGGDLKGIQQQLPYLQELGVTVLYLSPIFRARSNHKYNTGDYMQVDRSFGTAQDFRSLCDAAKARGMRVMLDGVFSHTGSDSRYFNREGEYESVGAYQSKDSPYASWYHFEKWPDQYESWWGFDTLPCVNKLDPSYLDYMIRSDRAVGAHWLREGASGWRLDVADELPMEFLRLLRARVRREDESSALLGEVWENASCKVAYDELRCYCLGDTLDSCMNYPLREMLFDFLLGRGTASEFARRLDALHECYPAPFFYSLMNLLSSHDKARAINVLSGSGDMEPPRDQRSPQKLDGASYDLGSKRLLLAWCLVNALPGMPSLYYADEAGAQGMADPFCRGTYPWGREDVQLRSQMRRIIWGRKSSPVWTRGALRLYAPTADVLIAVRTISGGKDVFGQDAPNGIGVCAINRSPENAMIELPPDDVIAQGIKIELRGFGSKIWMQQA